MRCKRNRLPGSLPVGPLDKKKDEETLFNKAAPARLRSAPQGRPEMKQREREQGGMEVRGAKIKRKRLSEQRKGQQNLRDPERG
ncbi:Transmembrane channel-like protein 4 [Dissostichus eleginoides]|uniref:Transmembrane channel-like protein 4 n=1 Tax=Dissostichus eleginoides TaxID=100907 RepID=A0AAD9CIT0_DISEL|nr:Transmembrane channel-like protein 4 [Dissostichus eleginoides]